MRTDPPLGNLQNRLRSPGQSVELGSEMGEDTDSSDVPSWVPDGRVGQRERWISAIRADPGRAGGIALAVIAALAVLVTLFTLIHDRPAPVVAANLPAVEMVSSAAPRTSGAQPASEQPLVVSVVGLVHQAGLVTLAPGARVADAVRAAGGVLDGADTIGLNMAGRVADGQQIVVGVATPAGQSAALGSSTTGSAEPRASAQAAGPKGAPIDLNSATAEQLDELPGVGPVTATAIVAWRDANGKFKSVDELGDVDGIGPARLEKLRKLVSVG
jgi:competence protein ComEA